MAPALAEMEQANPMRKIINLLQEMRKQVEVDGEKRQELFDAFMCYCQTNKEKTQKSIEDQTAKIDSLKSTIEELSGSNEQLKAEVKEISEELAEDEEAVSEATKVRKSEADAFAEESADMRTSIAALDKAIPALRKGLETSELQQGSDVSALLQSLRGPLIKGSQMIGNREEVLALLQGQQPAGGSAQILGIIQQMRENFKENLEKSLIEEEEAIATYDQLMGSKGKEIKAAKKELEAKKTQIAAQVQGIADAKEEMDDTMIALKKDQAFLISLKKKCKAETELHEATKKTMMEEQKAIQETIKILNDDDALEMFKKTVPSPGSFLQVNMLKSRRRALRRISSSGLSFVQTMKPDQFAELKKMINKMIADMKQEQKDDDKHKEWCQKEFDLTEDSMKTVQDTIDGHKQKIEEKTTELQSIQEAYANIKKQIADLDSNMLLATAQRKKEKAEYDQIVSEITISLSLLKKARDKMASFYEKPSLTQVQDQDPLSQQNTGFSQVETMFGFGQAAEQDQPASAGSYEKKGGAAMGILKMLDDIRADLKVEQKEVEMEEKQALSDYEATMTESKDSKEAKEKDIIAKEGQMGRLSEEIQVEQKDLGISNDEMTSLKDKEKALHDSCDFLLANYDIRKKARSSEMEGLQKSIAILSGAKLSLQQQSAAQLQQLQQQSTEVSLLQTENIRHLRRALPAAF